MSYSTVHIQAPWPKKRKEPFPCDFFKWQPGKPDWKPSPAPLQQLSATWGLLQVCENTNQLLALQGKAPWMQVGPSMRWPSPPGTHQTSSPAPAFPDQCSAQREVMSAQLSRRVSWHNHDFKKSNVSLQAWRVSSLEFRAFFSEEELDKYSNILFHWKLHSL